MANKLYIETLEKLLQKLNQALEENKAALEKIADKLDLNFLNKQQKNCLLKSKIRGVEVYLEQLKENQKKEG